MFEKAISFLMWKFFGRCDHPDRTWPRKLPGGGHYITCPRCSGAFEYDFGSDGSIGTGRVGRKLPTPQKGPRSLEGENQW